MGGVNGGKGGLEEGPCEVNDQKNSAGSTGNSILPPIQTLDCR